METLYRVTLKNYRLLTRNSRAIETQFICRRRDINQFAKFRKLSISEEHLICISKLGPSFIEKTDRGTWEYYVHLGKDHCITDNLLISRLNNVYYQVYEYLKLLPIYKTKLSEFLI